MTDPIHRRVIERVRQPEYTGKYRCMPCTVLNVAIGALLGAVVGVLWIPAGVGLFLLTLVLIYLRGYLVPGTPTLTKRYLPQSVLRLFKGGSGGGHSVGPTTGAGAGEDGVAIEGSTGEDVLRTMNVIEDCADGEDICLTDEFRTAWREEIDQVESTTFVGHAATLLDEPHESVSLDTFGEGVTASIDDVAAVAWESEAAMQADFGAASVLDRWVDGWDRLDPATRCNLLSKLRVFIERCPTCGGDITEDLDEITSCCADVTTVGRRCLDCGANLFEVEFEEDSRRQGYNEGGLPERPPA